MAIKINPSVFREYDIRGIAEKEFSDEFVHAIGLAYGKLHQTLHAGKKPCGGRNRFTVTVGRDCRLTSDRLADALISGLRQSGLDVISLGVCPTPLTYFSIFHLETDGGIMVTGSHNAAEYNGFKICVGRDTIHGAQIQELRKIIEAGVHPGKAVGSFSEHKIIPDYIHAIQENIGPQKKKKIVLDAGNGTAGSVAPELFKRLGAEVIPLYCDLDGRFPNHHPDPTVVENLKDLVAAVKKNSADFGIAFDGDSDRVGLVDETGRIIFGDELMVILSRSVLKARPGATIISEVKSSHRLYNDIAAKGGKPLMWKTGHSLIKSKMKETGALLAGEMSGHIFFSDRYFGYDDAIYAAARVYEIAVQSATPVSSLIADLPPMVATPEIRVDCVEEKKFNLVEETKNTLKKLPHAINDIDGIRVDFGDGWGLLRASNTQPALVLRFEAPSQGRMKEIRTVVESALKKAADTVGHPPLEIS